MEYIYVTNPEMIKYFVNIEDTYKYSYGSHKKVLCKCPICGFEKEIRISSLYKYGFSCPRCSDGISYPEKFMINLLKQLNIKFIWQYSKTNKEWCNKYRYDFYFEKDGQEYMIETNGEQHYKDGKGKWGSLKEIQQNDKNKFKLAINNGIKPKNYIVIDCRKSELEWIKNNILNSRLNEIFNLSSVNWNNIGEKSEKSLVKEVCDSWNNKKEEETVTDLQNIFGIWRTNLIKYLKRGTLLGWCIYNPKEEYIKGVRKENKNGKQVEIFKDGQSLGIFPSCHELERQSEKLFGIKLLYKNISSVCNGTRKSYKGYTFRYI